MILWLLLGEGPDADVGEHLLCDGVGVVGVVGAEGEGEVRLAAVAGVDLVLEVDNVVDALGEHLPLVRAAVLRARVALAHVREERRRDQREQLRDFLVDVVLAPAVRRRGRGGAWGGACACGIRVRLLREGRPDTGGVAV